MYKNFDEIHKDIIKYQWWGHSHNDQFVLLSKNNGNNELEYYSSGMVGHSIMPDKRFPAFRIYEYDTDSFKLLDYHHLNDDRVLYCHSSR